MPTLEGKVLYDIVPYNGNPVFWFDEGDKGEYCYIKNADVYTGEKFKILLKNIDFGYEMKVKVFRNNHFIGEFMVKRQTVLLLDGSNNQKFIFAVPSASTKPVDKKNDMNGIIELQFYAGTEVYPFGKPEISFRHGLIGQTKVSDESCMKLDFIPSCFEKPIKIHFKMIYNAKDKLVEKMKTVNTLHDLESLRDRHDCLF